MILFLLNAFRLTCNVMRYIFDLFMRYPMQFIIILLFLYAYWQKLQLGDIQQEYTEYKRTIQFQADMQKAKNEILRKQAQDDRDGLIAEHKRQLAEAGLERDKVTKNLKGSINEISNELNIYRDAISLRNYANSVGVSKMAEDTLSISSTSGNCNETLATVVDACKVTDYDYEALYNLYNKQCKIYGCE